MFRVKIITASAALCLLTATFGIGSAEAGYPRRIVRAAVVAPRVVARPYYGVYRPNYGVYRPYYGAYRPGVSVGVGGYPRYGYGYPRSGVSIQIGGFN